MAQTLASDLIIKIDQFVVSLEEEGTPFQEILSELIEYVEICKELDE
ncbi:gp23 [Synechococcus phage Syn5]|uniref:Gp23 n=1 Tax=Synechococcus phage Syn5 TaxID=2914003 RepID=A4ZRA4_9CAUD|nr:gp23 [Synechococcus phage Syn5]ABP87930.1 gp23 [Synechococcus phage Syn5]